MIHLLFLPVVGTLLCQTSTQIILPVAGLGPNYETKPAKDAFLFGAKRLLSAGPNGVYILEPNNLVVKVDNDGILQRFATVPGIETLRDTDAVGNYFSSNGTSIQRTDLLGSQSVIANFFSLDATSAALARNPTRAGGQSQRCFGAADNSSGCAGLSRTHNRRRSCRRPIIPKASFHRR